MEIKQGDTVVIDGKTAKVQTSWGAGAHKVYKLDDDREITDLDKLIEMGKASLIPSVVKRESPSPRSLRFDLSVLDEK